MIPNVFISSTISDLKYLRDGLRDAVAELAYHPVMSDHGEVGYLHPTTAAASCYRSVRQCQIVVLIVGKKYGSGVTHKEFQTAKEHDIPIITFVEAEVLSYKNLYKTDPSGNLWDNIPGMDDARKTFQLIDEITESPTYNGLIPFDSVAQAQRILKTQIADFVGERLNDTIRPIRSEVQEVLAEIKTLRNQSIHPGGSQNAATRYLTVAKFLLQDRNADYRKLLEQITGDLDSAIPLIEPAASFDDVIASLGGTIRIENDPDAFNEEFRRTDQMKGQPRIMSGVMGARGFYSAFSNNLIVLNDSMLVYFRNCQTALRNKLEALG